MKIKNRAVSRLVLATMTFGIALFPVTNSVAAQSSKSVTRMTTFVGGDIHTLTLTKNGLFVTGHEGGSYSTDEGMKWRGVPTLTNTDIMGWATTSSGFLAGGHNGLYRSTNGGKSFTKFNFYGKTSDVHALGAEKKTVYMGSPQVGFLRSVDGGKSWKVINKKIGQGFMGSMLVDVKNPLRVIAPDMQNGLVETTDGGKTWTRFGGPSSPMSVDWSKKDPRKIIVLGMGGGAITKDDGNTWSTFSVPLGSAALAFSATGTSILVATLVGKRALILKSNDDGKHWR